MPTISIRLTRNEYKELRETVERWNQNNPPSSMTAIVKWLLIRWLSENKIMPE